MCTAGGCTPNGSEEEGVARVAIVTDEVPSSRRRGVEETDSPDGRKEETDGPAAGACHPDEGADPESSERSER